MVLAACFLMVMITLGFGSSTKSLFPDEISKALGVERSLVSLGESCRYVATAVVNVYFSFLILKFGAKKLIGAGFASLIAAALLYSVATELWMIYLAGTLLGIGFSWTGTTMVGYVVELWCAKNKGTIMGILLASNGLGGAIAIRVVGDWIDPAVTGSYRGAYRLIALVFAVTMLVVLLLFRSRPKEKEEKKKSAPSSLNEEEGVEFSRAVKGFAFWGALVCVFFSGMILQGTDGISAMHMKDVGIDYGAVKSLLSFSSLLLAASKFLTGFIYDRFGLRWASGICTLIAIVSTFLLAFVRGDETGFVLAVVYSVIRTFSLPLETVMLPIYASDLFGKRSYPKILGLFVSVNVSGYAVGAPLMNLCYDWLGSYVPALILVGCLMGAVFVLLQFVIRSAHKERKMAQQP